MRIAALVTFGFILLLVPTRPASAQERYSALAVNLREGSLQTSLVGVSVERWSDDAEKARYLEILKTQGTLVLFEAFRHAGRVGHLSIADHVELDVEYAVAIPQADGSRRVLLLGYRNVSLNEEGNNTSRSRFRFIAVELRLKPKGDGEGLLALQADVSIGKNDELQFVDFASPSTLLKRVKSR